MAFFLVYSIELLENSIHTFNRVRYNVNTNSDLKSVFFVGVNGNVNEWKRLMFRMNISSPRKTQDFCFGTKVWCVDPRGSS